MNDPEPVSTRPRVVVVGGGLAGLAAAAALADRGLHVELFEARRTLAGRAGSFHDRSTGEWIDHCQHVSMGCCTNLADFCRRLRLDDCFRRDRVLHFFAPDGQRYDLAASRWLPAPLHLAPAFLKQRYLSARDKLAIARAMWKLARWRSGGRQEEPSIGEWLGRERQSQAAIEYFWAPVLVSALGESLEQASIAYARKVFVDGFLASRDAYELLVPKIPLHELYDERLRSRLAERGVLFHVGTPVEQVLGGASLADGVVAGGGEVACEAVVVAVPWRRVGELFPAGPLRAALPQLDGASQLGSAPITGVHLWFDRPITDLPHAVLLGTTSQWLFRHDPASSNPASTNEHYYQVVISASHELGGQDREAVAMQVVDELGRYFPAVAHSRLLRWQLVSEQAAVFSARPGVDALRPAQRTAVSNLALAGDWTATGWPSTMEGAVRSGYLAAEAILAHLGRPERVLVDDLPRGRLARALIA